MTDRPFRFGIITETFQDRRQLQTLACTAEHLGFDTLLIRDHLAPDYFGPQFAPLPTLAFLAAVTTHLRLGTMVAANDFRHPTILAKEAATIDALSEGRFELGIGAGWLQREYEQIGLPYDRNGLRIDRLEESLEIIHRCFTENDISFAGKVYNLDRYQPFPAPVQPTGPPLLIGAGVIPHVAAGKYADSVGLLTVSVSSGELRDDVEARRTKAVRERIAHVHDGAEPGGRCRIEPGPRKSWSPIIRDRFGHGHHPQSLEWAGATLRSRICQQSSWDRWTRSCETMRRRRIRPRSQLLRHPGSDDRAMRADCGNAQRFLICSVAIRSPQSANSPGVKPSLVYRRSATSLSGS